MHPGFPYLPSPVSVHTPLAAKESTAWNPLHTPPLNQSLGTPSPGFHSPLYPASLGLSVPSPTLGISMLSAWSQLNQSLLKNLQPSGVQRLDTNLPSFLSTSLPSFTLPQVSAASSTVPTSNWQAPICPSFSLPNARPAGVPELGIQITAIKSRINLLVQAEGNTTRAQEIERDLRVQMGEIEKQRSVAVSSCLQSPWAMSSVMAYHNLLIQDLLRDIDARVLQLEGVFKDKTPASPPASSSTQARPIKKASRRASALSTQAVNIMKAWWDSHQDHPYPTEEMVRYLQCTAGITKAQVLKWFANKRRRTGRCKGLGTRQKRKVMDDEDISLIAAETKRFRQL